MLFVHQALGIRNSHLKLLNAELSLDDAFKTSDTQNSIIREGSEITDLSPPGQFKYYFKLFFNVLRTILTNERLHLGHFGMRKRVLLVRNQTMTLKRKRKCLVDRYLLEGPTLEILRSPPIPRLTAKIARGIPVMSSLWEMTGRMDMEISTQGHPRL